MARIYKDDVLVKLLNNNLGECYTYGQIIKRSFFNQPQGKVCVFENSMIQQRLSFVKLFVDLIYRKDNYYDVFQSKY